MLAKLTHYIMRLSLYERLNYTLALNFQKVLTLASNERIALTKMMRLVFEIYTLRSATPATVSRAGILYINPHDLGWSAYALNCS